MATVQQPAPRRRTLRHTFRMAILVLALGILAAFAIGNSGLVNVWPFRQNVPLFAVVLGCFGLGLIAGWVGRGLAQARKRRETDSAPRNPDPG